MSHAALLFAALSVAQAPLRVDPPVVSLTGTAARWSLLVSAADADGRPRDLTRVAAYTSRHPAVARVDDRGVVHAVGDGVATVVVRAEGRSAEVTVRVAGTARRREYHFANDVLPVLSRHACNASGCHGKAEGQNGFKLSVFGFDPAADFASLVKEGRGRRLLPAAPAHSLLVRKMSGQAPHGGGARIRPGTPDYDTVTGWIAAGMPLGRADAARVRAIRVEPAERTLPPRGGQQLRVVARYDDGREADVTALARFVSNDAAVAAVDADGLVSAGDVPGDAAIMAGFLNAVAVCRVLVPRGGGVARQPALAEHNVIDRLVHARLAKLNVLPSDVCDDATFLRRAYLDVIGAAPTPAEVRRFLADRRPDRRTRLVEGLLARPEYADYWALKWADLLRVDRAALGAKQARAYHRWVRAQVAANTPLDRFARAVVTAEGPLDEAPQAAFFKAARKPGEMASAVAQVFLGVRIACAECHHHPFDRWGQADYHGMAAFFSGVRVSRAGAGELLTTTGVASARHPRTGATLFAHALGEPAPPSRPAGDARGELADWLTRPANPYFARNLANRVWAHLLGRGLVEPLDDVRATNPPTNPELLDALADHLVKNGYDVQALIRLITASRTYQLSTRPNATNGTDTRNYSRAQLRRLPAEVLLDLLGQATGVPERFRGEPPGTRAVQLWDSKVPHYFLKAFGRTERTSACECERNPDPSVAQVLHLMNAPEVEAKLAHAAGSVARLVGRHADDAALAEELYLTFFARPPSAREKAAALRHFQENRQRRREAAEDLAWGMLNSLEFAFNH